MALLPGLVAREAVVGSTVVVVDVLRAGATVATALGHGANRVIPVRSVSEARRLARELKTEGVLLCGERRGLPPRGFDLGNSPREFSPERVSGRTLVFTTTNGTRALQRADGAGRVAFAGLVNAPAVAEWAGHDSANVHILCAGQNGALALEDVLCAGLLVARLVASQSAELTDSARAALAIWNEGKTRVRDVLRQCAHGRYLRSVGFAEDVDYCSQVGTLHVVPVLRDGALVDIAKRRIPD